MRKSAYQYTTSTVYKRLLHANCPFGMHLAEERSNNYIFQHGTSPWMGHRPILTCVVEQVCYCREQYTERVY